jgi:hypothetical protein
MMALILWLLVASCCILIASLLELRIMLKLFQTFEFWLLNGLNLFSLAACLYFTVATNAAAAEFNGWLVFFFCSVDLFHFLFRVLTF